MLEIYFIYLIVILGTINVLRMSFSFVLGDAYNILRVRKSVSKKKYYPLISVVISAYNEEGVILRTITSVLQSTYKRIEIIVVDDGSKDGTSRVVSNFIKTRKYKNITLVTQTNGGKATGLNNGMKNYAKGSLIMCLDADSTISPDAIERVVAHFQDKSVASVASNVRIIRTKGFLNLIQYIEYLMGHRLKKAFSVLNNEYIVGGIGSTFRTSVLKKINYYDTDTVTEDIDLTMKILRLGNKKNKVIFASDVICHTEAVMNLGDLFKQRYRWKFGRFQTLFKNRDLFFNISKKYSKSLTFLQLPFVLYSELTFLLDPILIGFMGYICVRYRDFASFLGVFGFLAFYSIITITTDEYLNTKEKVLSLIYTPLTYMFFFLISVVEYLTLIKAIINIKGIIHAKRINKCGWEHVDRSVATSNL